MDTLVAILMWTGGIFACFVGEWKFGAVLLVLVWIMGMIDDVRRKLPN
jgi:hypothetical protein